MTFTRVRWLAAVLLLALMAVNFTAEGLALYMSSRALFVAHGEVASCCSGKKPTVEKHACGCPDCGDNCPMGNACTCGSDGGHHSRGTGLFFQAPGCHPDDDVSGSSYLPLSLRLVFVKPADVVVHGRLAFIRMTLEPAWDVAGERPSPAVPPPRWAVA